MTRTNLTREQRRAIAALLIQKAGDLIEFWSDAVDQAGAAELTDVSSHDAADAVAGWLAHLPGAAWDNRLPNPTA